MINDDLIKYITDFLVKCDYCNKLDIISRECCICKKKYCNNCNLNNINFRYYDVSSFTTSTYCSDCYYGLYIFGF